MGPLGALLGPLSPISEAVALFTILPRAMGSHLDYHRYPFGGERKSRACKHPRRRKPLPLWFCTLVSSVMVIVSPIMVTGYILALPKLL